MENVLHAYKKLEAWQHAKQLCVELHLELNFLPNSIIKNEIHQSSIKALQFVAQSYLHKQDSTFKLYLIDVLCHCTSMNCLLDVLYETEFLEIDKYQSLIYLVHQLEKSIQGILKYFDI